MATNQQPPVAPVAAYWPGTAADGGDPASGAAYQRTGKTKKDLLANYDVRLNTSRKWRAEKFDRTWQRMIDLYRGKQFVGESDADRIMVNLCFSTINVMLPAVAVNHPQITVNGRDPSMQDAATKAEAAANYWWRRWDFQDEVQRAVKDSMVISHGWAKVGWVYDQKFRAMTADERQQIADDMIAQVNQYAAENPEVAPELPTDDDIYESIDAEMVPEVSEDRPFVHRVSPFDMLVDPESTCEQDLKWVAQRLVVPLARAKGDKRYKQSARRALKADMSTNPRWRDENGKASEDKSESKRSDEIMRVTLWEYWDIEHEFYCLFAQDADDFLIEPTDFPYAFGCPFVYLPNHEVPDQFYSVGDLEMLEPMQQELNAVRSDMMNHRKRWQRAYLAHRNKFDNAAQQALTSSRDNRVIWIDDENTPLQDLVVPLPQLPLDPQMYQYSETIEADVMSVTGVSEYERGQTPEIRRTATEASLINDATNARVSDKLAQVEKFMAQIATRVVQLAQQYLTGEHVARIQGPDGQPEWQQFTRDEIAGEFDFVVEAGSTQPKNESFKRQQALQLTQALAPYVGVAVEPTALVTYVLQEGFGIKDPSPFIIQQDPNQEPQFTQKMIESMAYKDAPPDIQRQMEEQAGFQPSEIGGVSIVEQQAADQQHESAQADRQTHDQAMLQLMQQHAQARQQEQQAKQQPKQGGSGGGSAKR